MTDLRDIRDLAMELHRRQREQPIEAPDDDPWGDDEAFAVALVPLAAAGAWMRDRIDELGRLRLTREESLALLASARGRQLAAELAEELDLGALALEQPAAVKTLDDARRAMRRRLLQRHAPTPVATLPMHEQQFAAAASTTAIPLRRRSGQAITGIDALIAAEWFDARVFGDGLLAALGHVQRGQGDPQTPALLLVAKGKLGSLSVGSRALEAGQTEVEAALVEARNYPAWPALARGGAVYALALERKEVDTLALAALQALTQQRFDEARQLLAAIGCGESAALDDLASTMRAMARELEDGVDE